MTLFSGATLGRLSTEIVFVAFLFVRRELSASVFVLWLEAHVDW